MPRAVRSIQALLSTRATGNALRTRRTKTAGVLTFLEAPIAGDDNRFVERTIRIAPLLAPRRPRRGRRFGPPSPPAPGA